jgi:hypothetical protein
MFVGPTPHDKLGNVARTYRPVGNTCPSACSLLNRGCYAQLGRTNFQQEKAKQRHDSLTQHLRLLPKGTLVRHLVSGDLFHNDQPDPEVIRELTTAHKQAPHVQGWGYTHGWKQLQPTTLNLKNLTFNASCESPQETQEALQAGWPVVAVVPENHPKLRVHPTHATVVCPEQYNKQVTCQTCQLCLKPNRKYRNLPLVVGFRTHSNKRRSLNEAITQRYQP